MPRSRFRIRLLRCAYGNSLRSIHIDTRDIGLDFQLDKIRLGSRPCREAELILIFQSFAQVLKKRLKGNWVAEPLPVEFPSGCVCDLSQKILSGVGLIAAAVEAACVAE